MSDTPWLDKATFMREHGKSERTVQLWVRQGKAERQIIDGKGYYRLAPLHPVAVQHPPDTPPWAVELLEEIRALRAEIAAQKALQAQTRRPVGYTERNADPPVAQQAERGPFNPEVPDSSSGRGLSAETPPPATERNTVTPPQRGILARLFGRAK